MVGEVPSKLWTSCNQLTEVRFEVNDLTGDALGGAGADVLAECKRLKLVNFGWTYDLDTSELWKGIMAWCRKSIVYVHLGGTRCTGPIPTEIGNCVALEVLWLNKTQITGPIPAEIGNCVSVKILHLNETQISGSIPTTIGNCIALEQLRLYQTQITGPIPTEIGNCVALKELSLSSTQITGRIPTEIGNCVALEKLWLRNCKLTGAIPVDALAKCTHLKEAYLGGNQFDGDAEANKSALKATLPDGCKVAC